jgi:ectoine hydroxylase-related dioxygenase (phytanoyl-CoA dioxygenase family)
MTDTLSSRLTRIPTNEELDDFERDGAAVLRGVLDASWIDSMREAIEVALEDPGPMSREYTKPKESGRYFGDFFLWRRFDAFRALMADSPLPELAARLMNSQQAFFFYDQLLVKEPATAAETPLHHDLPYWPVRGKQIVSIWVPFDRVTPESGAVTYIRRSHRWGKMFAPAAFGDGAGYDKVYAAADLETIPDLDRDIDPADHLAWSLDPGDVLIHHPLTLHFAPGNQTSDLRRRGLALRYVGDDAVYDDRPGTFLESAQMKAHLPELGLEDGEPFRGDLFPKIWPKGR